MTRHLPKSRIAIAAVALVIGALMFAWTAVESIRQQDQIDALAEALAAEQAAAEERGESPVAPAPEDLLEDPEAPPPEPIGPTDAQVLEAVQAYFAANPVEDGEDASPAQIAAKYAGAHSMLFLGRQANYPIALEGALKLKEISYIHAEAYPAGELKHGPLALVTDEMPVVTVAPNDALLEKLKSNIQEVRARGGKLYVFADADTHIQSSDGIQVIRMPEHYGQLSPILHVVPLQLLAYHTALARGTDVDKPRNLAKSVTVE